MNYQIDELPDREVKLTIEVDDQRVQQGLRKAARHASKHVNIRGFRRGKAPYRMVEQAVGRERLLQEAIEEMLPVVLGEAIKETGLEPYDLRFIDIDLASESPLTFQVIVPLFPEVTLGDLGEISVPAQSTEVSEEQLTEVLEQLRASHSSLASVEGPALYEDEVTVDLTGFLMNGAIVDERQNEKLLLVDPEVLFDDWDDEDEWDEEWEDEADDEQEGDDDRADDSLPISDDQEPAAVPLSAETAIVEDEERLNPQLQLLEAIKGMMVNQVKEAPVVYPDDWDEETLRGRTVLYRITVTQIDRSIPRELDSAFVKEVTEDLDSVEALRERIRGNMEIQAEADEFDRRLTAILDELVELSDLSYPDAVVQVEVYRRIDATLEQLAPLGINLERYLELTGQTRDGLEDLYWDAAEEMVCRSLVFGEFIRQEEISLDDEQLAQALRGARAEYGGADGDDLGDLSPKEQQRIAAQALNQHAMAVLYSRVTGEEVPAGFTLFGVEDDSPETGLGEDAPPPAEPRDAQDAASETATLEGGETPVAESPVTASEVSQGQGDEPAPVSDEAASEMAASEEEEVQLNEGT